MLHARQPSDLTEELKYCTHRVTPSRRVRGLFDFSVFAERSSSSPSDLEAGPALSLLRHHLAISGKVPLEVVIIIPPRQWQNSKTGKQARNAPLIWA